MKLSSLYAVLSGESPSFSLTFTPELCRKLLDVVKATEEFIQNPRTIILVGGRQPGKKTYNRALLNLDDALSALEIESDEKEKNK